MDGAVNQHVKNPTADGAAGARFRKIAIHYAVSSKAVSAEEQQCSRVKPGSSYVFSVLFAGLGDIGTGVEDQKGLSKVPSHCEQRSSMSSSIRRRRAVDSLPESVARIVPSNANSSSGEGQISRSRSSARAKSSSPKNIECFQCKGMAPEPGITPGTRRPRK